MAYGAIPDALDEYLQMGTTTACKSLQMFCKAIMELYGEEFLRKPTYTDMKNSMLITMKSMDFLGCLLVVAKGQVTGERNLTCQVKCRSRSSTIVTSLKDDLFFFARGVLESTNVIMEALRMPVTLFDSGWSRSDKVKVINFIPRNRPYLNSG
uniref:Uncharacterized protein n=1 Tax=Tanacetum cinerariifolium TaxID=118510 RepID=A0A699GUW5_TANCI|nr:hypothetical protein [Tanacetum cinerariifolium]